MSCCPRCGRPTSRQASQVGELDVCGSCHRAYPVRQGGLVEVAPVLGIDPGQRMGLGVVVERHVLWTAQLDWRRASQAEELARLVGLAVRDGCRRAVIEILGTTREAARGRATSWAVMSRTAGRAAQECERQGFDLMEMDAGTWRSALGLPRSFGEGGEKDRTARQHAHRLLALEGCSVHECEAALMALAGGLCHSRQ